MVAVVVVDADVVDRMKDNMNCPICKKEVFSNIGNGCMMCGMPIKNEEFGKFCCKICMRKYNTINHAKGGLE